MDGGVACSHERVNRLTRKAGGGNREADSETCSARDKESSQTERQKLTFRNPAGLKKLFTQVNVKCRLCWSELVSHLTVSRVA